MAVKSITRDTRMSLRTVRVQQDEGLGFLLLGGGPAHGLDRVKLCVWVLTYAIWVQQDEGGPALGLDRVKLCVWVLTYAIWA